MDVELIRRAKSRDPDAFTELMRSQMNSMYKTARQILQSDEDIADAVQDTLLTCWQKLDQLRDERAWRAWMMRILINNCYEQIRKHGLESSMDILPEAAAYSENYEQTEWQDLLWRLDEKYRMVLILYYLEGFRGDCTDSGYAGGNCKDETKKRQGPPCGGISWRKSK